jgi:hypothetical protein
MKDNIVARFCLYHIGPFDIRAELVFNYIYNSDAPVNRAPKPIAAGSVSAFYVRLVLGSQDAYRALWMEWIGVWYSHP